ncbi:hypothetical protein BVI2075_960062 [Burkholderia vietnamiensis]|nr:hypothetical protein BVI2075_960062 [Burkholderia vietnamiensis]
MFSKFVGISFCSGLGEADQKRARFGKHYADCAVVARANIAPPLASSTHRLSTAGSGLSSFTQTGSHPSGRALPFNLESIMSYLYTCACEVFA